VQREVVDALPLAGGAAPDAALGTADAAAAGLLLPDEDLAVVARRGEDVAVLGVRPGDAPDGAFVSAEKPGVVSVGPNDNSSVGKRREGSLTP